jgi:glycosyltransferase involved in cell wall biosynthesis
MAEPLRTAAFRAEPDGYDISQPKLMGRQSAGYSFLRAAVAARAGGPLYGYTALRASIQTMRRIVQGLDPAAELEWLTPDAMGRLSEAGVFYLADPTVAQFARLRLRWGPAAFSLCGVTHTTASGIAMDAIAALVTEPVMPWDALICTSQSVVDTVRMVMDAQLDYFRWRFGRDVAAQGPQLPLIPLGVHCDDFQFSAAARREARKALALAEDEVAGLFVGRLVFHAKAHPYAMFKGLQAAAERTGRKVALILCGWFPNASVETAFMEGAARYAPAVRTILVDGRDDALRNHAWAGSDIFVSLSDNIQETFGLTPVEAMAAGLPCVVSDYDGYKDTVRDGLDGYRVRTWAPAPGMGQPIARAFEAQTMNYDNYCWAAAASTAIDPEALADRLAALVADPALRRRLGEAGRRRAREVFDWSVVYRQYQALWGELNARRLAAMADPAQAEALRRAPASAAARLDPFQAFGHYPSGHITGATQLSPVPGASAEALAGLVGDALFSNLTSTAGQLQAMLAHVNATGPGTVAELGRALGQATPVVARAAGFLAKVGLIRLG